VDGGDAWCALVYDSVTRRFEKFARGLTGGNSWMGRAITIGYPSIIHQLKPLSSWNRSQELALSFVGVRARD